MGKFFALVIIVFMAVWLAPMCARLPSDLSTLSAPPAPAAPAAAPVAPAPAAAPAPVPAPAPAPAPKPAAKGSVALSTFRIRTMFPEENGKYVVSILRANRTDEEASVRMTLAARKGGQILERAESGPAQTLAAGSTSYFGLGLSTFVLDEVLDAPEDAGTGLEWSLSYRLAGDAPGMSRCYRLNARPKRREPAGIDWLPQGESRSCAP